MSVADKPYIGVPPFAGRGVRRHAKGIIALAFLALGLILAGCGRQVPPFWPGLSVDAEADEVYVAQANGQVFALNADNGDLLWVYPATEGRSGGLLGGCSARTPADGPFVSPPAIGEEYLFLASAGEQQRSLLSQGENQAGLRALSKQGFLQWEFRGTNRRAVASPTLAENTVYLASSDYNVYAIDLETRAARWTFRTGNWVWATPLVVDDTVYIASMDHVLYAVAASTGAEKWRFDRATTALPAMPVLADGVVYVSALNGYVYAVDAESGEFLWERGLDGGLWAAPLAQPNAVYVGTLAGKIYALQAADGTNLWEESVGGEIRGTPAVVGETLYVGSEDGRLYAFDAATGQPEASPLGIALERTSIYTAPVFDGQNLYVVATDGRVFALDVEANQVVWQQNPLNRNGEEE